MLSQRLRETRNTLWLPVPYGLLAGTRGLVGSALFHIPTPFAGLAPGSEDRAPAPGRDRQRWSGPPRILI